MPNVDYLLLIVLASQVLVGSVLLPARLLALTRRIVEAYPPASYAKLYPVGAYGVERARSRYRVVTGLVFLAGVALVVHGFAAGHEELLGWDSQSVLALYCALQWVPFAVIAASPGFPFFNLQRRADPATTRTASLRPRRMLDLAPRWLLALSVACYALFVAVVIAAPERWGAGYRNIPLVTFMYAFLYVVARLQVHGKRTDPYQSEEDRVRGMSRAVRLSAWVSIVGTLYLLIHVSLQPLGGSIADIASSVYFQVLFLLAMATFRIGDVDFEVYRGSATRPTANPGATGADPVTP